MKTFKKFTRPDMLHKLIKTSTAEATEFAQQVFEKHGRKLEEELPHFKRNFEHLQKVFFDDLGKREGLPRITPRQTKIIQKSLAGGYINFEKNSFPKGVADKVRHHWLFKGIDLDDNESIPVSRQIVRLIKLKPTQQVVYFDTALEKLASMGSEASKEFIEQKSIFIVTKDNYIVDGHDRWMGAFLMNKNMKAKVMRIDMDLKDLLPLTMHGSL